MRTIAVLVLTIVVVAAAAVPASAQSACAKLWYRVAAQAAKGTASCHAKAAATGLPVDGACLAAAEDKLARKWAKAALKGDCPTAADAADAQQVVDAFVTNLKSLLTPPTVSHCCATGNSCFSGPFIDAFACAELLGTMGAPGSVCEGATGACVLPPASGGPCCALTQFSLCTAGPTVNPADCVTGGGLDHPNGVCESSGACVFP